MLDLQMVLAGIGCWLSCEVLCSVCVSVRVCMYVYVCQQPIACRVSGTVELGSHCVKLCNGIYRVEFRRLEKVIRDSCQAVASSEGPTPLGPRCLQGLILLQGNELQPATVNSGRAHTHNIQTPAQAQSKRQEDAKAHSHTKRLLRGSARGRVSQIRSITLGMKDM